MKYKEREKPAESYLIPDMVSDEYFSVQSLKRAVWQYLVDHSKVVSEKGRLRVFFYIESEYNFWWRVKARDDGKFSRKDLLQLRTEEENTLNEILKLRKVKVKYDKLISNNKNWEWRIRNKVLTGSFKERLLLTLANKFKVWGRNLTQSIIIKSK